jgi:hypothetical protein
VQIWHGGTLEFGGYVVAYDLFPTGVYLDVVCHCVDWTVLMDKRVIAEVATWTDATALTILQDITEDGYVTEVDATAHTETGATGLDVESNYGYVGDLVEKLAETSDFYWDVREDEEGDVYLYFTDNVVTAPFGLSTTPNLSTTFPLRVLQWSVSGSEMVNKIYVVGESTVSTQGAGGTPLLEAVIKAGPPEFTLADQGVGERGEERITGRIELYYPGGLLPGMTIDIEHSVLNIDTTYLIRQVMISALGGGAVKYELTVSGHKGSQPSIRNQLRQLSHQVELVTV